MSLVRDVGKLSLTKNTSFCRQYIIFVILNHGGKIDTVLNVLAMCSPPCMKLALAAEWEITGYSSLNLQPQAMLSELPPCASKVQEAEKYRFGANDEKTQRISTT